MATIQLPYNYRPRSYHRRIYAALERGYRHLMLVMHRRSGKTESLLAYQPIPMLERLGNYAHVFPLRTQAKQVVWDGIGASGFRFIQHFPRALLAGPPNESELQVTMRQRESAAQGSTYKLFGTDRNIDALVGGNPVEIIWDEYALQNPLARDLARPILAENGGREIIPFTPRGENHAYHLFEYAKTSPDWHVEYLTVDDTRRDGPGEDGSPVITVEQIEAHRKEMLAQGIPGVDALIEQEYYLSWKAPMPGAYYADELAVMLKEGRITHVPFDARKPVFTCWDFGLSTAHDTNSVWFFQLQGFRVCWIDYYQASNKGIPHFVEMLQAKPYRYAKHFAMETDLDEADFAQGRTRIAHFRDHGIVFTEVPKLRLIDGIHDVRLILARSSIDATACREGVNGLRAYRREWDQEKRTFLDKPVHDWASHPEAAFRYGAVALMELDEFGFQVEVALAHRATRRGGRVQMLDNPLERW